MQFLFHLLQSKPNSQSKASYRPLSVICSPGKRSRGWRVQEWGPALSQETLPHPLLHLALAPSPQCWTLTGMLGRGGLQLWTSGFPPISAPLFLFCQQWLLTADGQQSKRPCRPLFRLPLLPHSLLRKVKGERGKKRQEGRVRVK